MHSSFDIAIIGGGASALMFASQLPKHYKIAILDANHSLAPKLKISGGGKCNATNIAVDSSNFVGDTRFVQSVLDYFSHNDLQDFLFRHGVRLSQMNRVVKGQLFCDSSKVLIRMFEGLIAHANLFMGAKVEECRFCDDMFTIVYNKTQKVFAKKVVVASGGCSYAALEASDIGLKIAASFGHKIIPTAPALVGLTVQKDEFWFKELSGVSFEASIKVQDKVFSGGLLFAHKGISGPIILNASLWWNKGKMSLDFLPEIQDITKIISKNPNKNVSNLFFLPKNFMKSFLNYCGIEDKKCALLSQEERQKLQLLKNYTFAPAGTFGYTKAEVMRGGVSTDEICHTSFQSQKQKGLYFIGEVLDVTGELGGYNLQWAFSSAKVCADRFK